MEFAEVKDLNICYRLAGEGNPVVLIMGFTANMDWWDPMFIKALSKRYRVLVFDNRGAGRTVTPREGEWSCELFADDTAALMDYLGLEHAHVLGLSMGGMIAQEFALKYPRKTNKLILGCTFCGGEHTMPPSPEVMQLFAQPGTPEELVERSILIMFPEEFRIANRDVIASFREQYLGAPISARNAARQFFAAVKLDTYDRLNKIKAPTLVATGTEDILVPPENSRTIAERIPGAKLMEYEGAGHGFFIQSSKTFLEDLLEFLGS